MTKYRKIPITIQAVQWRGGDWDILNSFCGHNWSRADIVAVEGPDDNDNIVIWNTEENQWLNLPIDHWIIRGINGEIYPCSHEVFIKTYELAE